MCGLLSVPSSLLPFPNFFFNENLVEQKANGCSPLSITPQLAKMVRERVYQPSDNTAQAREVTREAMTFPPGISAGFPWLALACMLSVGAYTAGPVGVHTCVLSIAQHLATCKRGGAAAFLLGLPRDTIWIRATPIRKQCYHLYPLRVCKLGDWAKIYYSTRTLTDQRVEPGS